MQVMHEIPPLQHLLNHFFLVFALLLSYLSRLGFPVQDFVAVVVHLGGVNGHMDRSAISLFSLDPFYRDDLILPVLDHNANLLACAVSSDNLNFVIISNGHRSNYAFVSGGDMIFSPM